MKAQRTTEQLEAGGYGPRPRQLRPRITDDERAAHAAFLDKVLKGKGVWAELGEGA